MDDKTSTDMGVFAYLLNADAATLDLGRRLLAEYERSARELRAALAHGEARLARERVHVTYRVRMGGDA